LPILNVTYEIIVLEVQVNWEAIFEGNSDWTKVVKLNQVRPFRDREVLDADGVGDAEVPFSRGMPPSVCMEAFK
jgi:hypothetical protein